MNIAITGGTGFIGRHVVPYLLKQGHRVAVISRSPRRTVEGAEMLTWDRIDQDAGLREGWDAIINLAGESISQRWTSTARERIVASRLTATAKVEAWVSRMKEKPAVVIQASGMNIYGTSETGRFDEASPGVQNDFLSDVVTRWEAAADRIRGVRLVKLRTGMVLGLDGGALSTMALPYRLGVGGRVGSGKQWISWIHIRDMVRLIAFALEEESLKGPVNAVSPSPVTNDTFGHILGRVLKRPHWLPVPGFALRLLLGELSDLILKGQHVRPAKLLEHGFRFEFAELEPALRNIILGGEEA